MAFSSKQTTKNSKQSINRPPNIKPFKRFNDLPS